MNEEISYTEAFQKLESLVEKIEGGNIKVDELTEKVKEAQKLMSVCEKKLRDVHTELKDL